MEESLLCPLSALTHHLMLDELPYCNHISPHFLQAFLIKKKESKAPNGGIGFRTKSSQDASAFVLLSVPKDPHQTARHYAETVQVKNGKK